mmetsp:Transcript_55210/g.142257  ORF Transcript_55210/g.142257 Transcript_55210/m.142257 type:complete len:82 (-) Transcript_55210:170-415(-)
MYAEMALPTAEQTPVFLQGSRQPGAVEASSGTKPVWQESADATTDAAATMSEFISGDLAAGATSAGASAKTAAERKPEHWL